MLIAFVLWRYRHYIMLVAEIIDWSNNESLFRIFFYLEFSSKLNVLHESHTIRKCISEVKWTYLMCFLSPLVILNVHCAHTKEKNRHLTDKKKVQLHRQFLSLQIYFYKLDLQIFNTNKCQVLKGTNEQWFNLVTLIRLLYKVFTYRLRNFLQTNFITLKTEGEDQIKCWEKLMERVGLLVSMW